MNQLVLALLITFSSASIAFDPTDTDGDSHPDISDNCTLVANFDQRDNDLDGYGNQCDGDLNSSGLVDSFDQQILETILADPFSNQFPEADFNVDGQVDLLDEAVFEGFLGFPPGPSQLGDLDRDGILDAADNCRLTFNQDQADFDANNVGDVCDDQDVDDVFDSTDNCIIIANPVQTDGDEDGYGNICDSDLNNDGTVDAEDRSLLTALLGTSDINADINSDGMVDASDQALLEAAIGNPPGPSLIGDIDYDGILDAVDNCISISNANQMDLDGDGFGAACDLDEVLITVGGEMQVSDSSIGRQIDPAIAADEMNNYVVVWTGNGGGSVYNDIYARLFNAFGEPQGNAFKVNTTDAGYQDRPAVVMSSEGDFTIAWEDTHNIYAQQFDLNGTPAGTEIQVSAPSEGNKNGPAIAMNESGGFIVVWDGNGADRSAWNIYARLFDEYGVAQGEEFVVNTTPKDDVPTIWTHSRTPAVSYSALSGYTIAWSGDDVDGTQDIIYMRQYSVTGSPTGDETRVTPSAQYFAGYPTIGHNSTGDFTVAWSGGEAEIKTNIHARMFNVQNGALTGVFRVNTYTPENQSRPKIGMNPEGNFIVVWQSWDQTDAWDVFAQRYDSLGQSDGAEFQVNGHTPNWQDSVDVVLNSENSFVVVWDSRGQDGPQERIYEQHFGIDTDRDSFLDVNDSCPLSDNPLDNIEIDGCDSGVQDVMLSNPLGCSIQDQILLLADVAKSHGQFKSRVAKLLKSWHKSGILEPDEKDAIKQCVAQSSLPR